MLRLPLRFLLLLLPIATFMLIIFESIKESIVNNLKPPLTLGLCNIIKRAH